jgi:Ulp1 family protease
MKKSGLADSPFFSMPAQKEASPPPPEKTTSSHKKSSKPKKSKAKTVKTSNHETVIPRYHDTTVSRYHDAIIEIVRKAVKELGKEAATHRFTQKEKQAIAEIIFTYKNRGIRTSENEIARIAVNFIIQDYKENGEESVLDKALNALND